jgi:hypothetical protein
MGDREKQKSRMTATRERLLISWCRPDRKEPIKFRDLEGILSSIVKCNPASLEKAAQYFGLDHTRTTDLQLLAHIMAEELFGQRAKGKPAGKKDFWTDARFSDLGARRYELKKGDKRLTEREIAEIISKEEPFRAYKNNPEQIRQRLPEARKRYNKALSDAQWDEIREHVDIDPNPPYDEYT